MRTSGVEFFKHKRHFDGRGWLSNINAEDFGWSADGFLKHSFVSHSIRGTLRGFHFQLPPVAQEKIVHVLSGVVLDVCFCHTDLSERPVFFEGKLGEGQPFDTVKVSDTMAHAFLVLSSSATLLYLNSAPYDSSRAVSINPVDPSLGYDWGSAKESLIISERDRCGLRWSDYITGV